MLASDNIACTMSGGFPHRGNDKGKNITAQLSSLKEKEGYLFSIGIGPQMEILYTYQKDYGLHGFQKHSRDHLHGCPYNGEWEINKWCSKKTKEKCLYDIV